MVLTVVLIIAVFGIVRVHLWSQKVETINGVRCVHNHKYGKWGKNPQIALKLIRTLGGVEAEDQNYAFYLPSDLVVDVNGNLYVLDSGNHRIQKFSPDGKYITTFGQKGQGPAEFYFPLALEIDDLGNIYVSDPNNQRIVVLTPEGKEHKVVKFIDGPIGDIALLASGELAMGGRTWFAPFSVENEKVKELPKLIKILSPEGDVLRGIGFQRDFGDYLLTKYCNSVCFSVDNRDQIFLTFLSQNRLEKYSPDGTLVWRADRELNYGTGPKDHGRIEREKQEISVRKPKMNTCSNGIAVDDVGRVWIVTLDRQLRKEEQTGIRITISYEGGQRSMNYRVESEAELRNTDAYKLEVYNPDGELLGEITVDHFVDGIFIYDDRLFLLDKMRGMEFYEYRISGQ